MKLKTCTCGKEQTTKNAKCIGVSNLGDWKLLLFNCSQCNSTFIGAKVNLKLGRKAV